jgi:hypothetical protein
MNIFSSYNQYTFIAHDVQTNIQVKLYLYVHFFILHSVYRISRSRMQTKFRPSCPDSKNGWADLLYSYISYLLNQCFLGQYLRRHLD